MAGKMVNGNERQVGRGRGGLRERDADEQRADEPRPLRHRDRAEVRPARVRLVERALDDAADVADVLSGRELGDDPAPLTVDRHLRRDLVRPNRPGLRGIAGFFDDGRRRFVAGGFYAEDSHTSNARFSDSSYGALKMPRSVMMPAMN